MVQSFCSAALENENPCLPRTALSYDGGGVAIDVGCDVITCDAGNVAFLKDNFSPGGDWSGLSWEGLESEALFVT